MLSELNLIKFIVENVDIYERLTRIENPEDIKYLIGIVC